MPDRLMNLAIVFVFLFLAAAPARAQEPSWGLRVFSNAGVNFPLRNLGKNAVEIQELSAIQVLAEVENSPSLGGGVEFLFPDRDIRIRGQFMTTVGATARGLLGLCDNDNLAPAGEGLCALDLSTDARIMDGTAELVFVAGAPSRWVRPIISFGLGVRSFEFESETLNCDEPWDPVDDEYQVCQRSKEILEDPSVNPNLTFGVGLEAERDLVSAFLRLYAVTATYSGGTGLADGGRQMDLALTGGLAFTVR